MAFACEESYSFVSIETQDPWQTCIFELHKDLPVRNTHFNMCILIWLGFYFKEYYTATVEHIQNPQFLF